MVSGTKDVPAINLFEILPGDLLSLNIDERQRFLSSALSVSSVV